jgi:hypothetical protein
MPDFRNPRDPLYRDLNNPAYGTGYRPAVRRTSNWGWVAAAAVSLAVVFIIAFTVGREPSRLATNTTALAAPAPAAPANQP